MRKSLSLLFFLFFLAGNTRADIVDPSVASRHFMIINTDQYKSFQFYREYYSYSYNQGYHAKLPDTLAVKNKMDYPAGSRDSELALFLAKDAKGKWYASSIRLGGVARVGTGVSKIIDVYKITSIKNGVIQLKKIREDRVYNNGKIKTTQMGSWLSGLGGWGNTLSLTALLALGGLVVLFMVKRKQPSLQPVANS